MKIKNEFDRRDYLEGKVNFDDYYSQFVTDSLKKYISRKIGIDKIKKSKDQHFNDIPLSIWDSVNVLNFIDKSKFKRLNNVTYGENDRDKFLWSLSNDVCIAKSAARLIKIESESSENAI